MSKHKSNVFAMILFVIIIAIMAIFLFNHIEYTFAGTNQPVQQVEEQKPAADVVKNKKAPAPEKIEEPQPYPSQQSSSEIRKQRIITVLWIAVAILAVAVIVLLIVRKLKSRK